MRQRRRRHHIGGTGADGGGDRHRPFARGLLGIGNRGMGHGLLIVAAIGAKFFARAMQRLAQTGHIAMAKDRPDPGEEGFALLVQLCGDIFHHRLRCG